MTTAELRNWKKKEMNKRARKRPMFSEDEEEEISLMEVYNRVKRTRLLLTDDKNIKKNTKYKSLPVYESSFEILKLYSDDEEESDEEILGDSERVAENDWGCKFVINQDKMTYTRVKSPLKIYYKSCDPRANSVLHDLNYPLSTVSKLALDRYNAIEGTNYQYLGLVKAYKEGAYGYLYTLRFKACLPHQHPVYFQAIACQPMPDRNNKLVSVHVDIVHPLPA